MRIAILHNRDENLRYGVEADSSAACAVLDEVESVADSCRKLGWEPIPIPVPSDPSRITAAITSIGADAVFNLVESFEGDSRYEAFIAAVLDASRIPYTGSPPRAMIIGLYKSLARSLLAYNGIPIPAGQVIGDVEADIESMRFPFPWIVKPLHEDASHGISTDSVVFSYAEAHRRIRYILETYRQPAMVEEFIEGREFNISILGEGTEAFALSPGEIDFSDFPSGKPRLVTYDAKWNENSPECRGTVSIGARDVDSEVLAHVVQNALAAYRIAGLRDYGRVDLRLRPDGKSVVLDINPNPDISPGAGLAKAAARSGISHEQLIERIVRTAIARGVSHKAHHRSGSVPHT